jgi:hypothetical protein
MGYRLDNRGSIPGRGGKMLFFSFLLSVQTDPGAHPASYIMATGCFFAVGKSTGV